MIPSGRVSTSVTIDACHRVLNLGFVSNITFCEMLALLSLTGVPVMFAFSLRNTLVPTFETSTADGGVSVPVRHKQ